MTASPRRNIQFRDVLFLRLQSMDEIKQNKIRKMLDNVKDGQDY